MAHAVRFRTAGGHASNQGEGHESGPAKWDEVLLQKRVEDNVFGKGFPRVLAGAETDEGQVDRDQEQQARLVQEDLDDTPDHFLGLYRTADEEDLGEFIEAFEEGVVFDAEWYVLEPHDCTHDREGGGPCKIYDGEELEDKMVRRGTVPEAFQ